MKCKIFLAVLITVLIISSACTSAVCMKIAKRNVERNNVLTPVRSLSTDTGKSLTAPTGTSYMKVGFGRGYINGDAEILSMIITEDVTILEDGTAHLAIIMDISSPTLVELYKKSFGIPDDATEIDIEIPMTAIRIMNIEQDDGTIIQKEIVELVREKFYEGVAEEQKHLFGFHIIEFYSSRIISNNAQNKLMIQIEAQAIPYITEVVETNSEVKLTLSSAPADGASYFIYSQMELTRIMLQSFSGEQVYKKTMNLQVHFPEDTKIINVNGRQEKLDFGATLLGATIAEKQSQTVQINEKWIIKEGETFSHEATIDKAFTIEYTLPAISYLIDYSRFDYDFSVGNLDDEPWSWSCDWDVISFSGEEGGISYSVDVDLYLTLSGSLHFDLLETYIYADFGIDAGLEVEATISGAWSHTFNLLGGAVFSGKKYGWRGMQTLVVTVDVEPVAELYVEAGGSVYVYLNPEANFDLIAGGDLDFVWEWPPVHFTPEFDYSLGGSFEKDFQLDAHATIRPSLGFAISLIVFEVIGPRITPTVYLEGTIGYNSNEGTYWHAVLGFDLIVGVQFTRFVHWDWPDPIYSVPIAEWDSGDPEWNDPNPEDNTFPETTLYMSPKVNGYVGPIAIFWFDAIDPGPDASGLDVTIFNIPEYEGHGDDWFLFDYNLIYLIFRIMLVIWNL